MTYYSIFFLPRGRLLCISFLMLLAIAGMHPAFSHAADGNLPPDVQKSLNKILPLQKSGVPDKATLHTLLDFATSPLVLRGTDDKRPFPAKYNGATGIFWRDKFTVPLKTMLQYLYDPKIPTTFVYPASIRYGKWQPGSDILSLSSPLWVQFGKHKESPLALRGVELEEITPDTFSGAYYKYTLDRLLLLTEFEGKQVLISVAWQRGNSNVGKKAAVIGDYENWDFVYSNAEGTLATGIGWAETYIYSSISLAIFYEQAPGSSTTGYTMFRWMDAGWSRMNMVKAHHIESGAERSITGLKSFLDSPQRPLPEELAAYVDSLRAMDISTLQKKLEPYSAKVEAAAATTPALKTKDFQDIIKNGGYGRSMDKDELIAALCVNYIKHKLGKPLLADLLR